MKKTTKIVTLIISAILLIGAVIGITASADNDPTVAIKYKNLAYEGAIQVLYAVEAENLPEGAKVQMYFYDAEPAEDSAPAYVKDEYTDEALTIGGKTYRAFFSKGIAPKNMRKSIFAVPVIVNGDAVVAKGECVEYSIYTYATNMLSKSPTAEQKELYTNLLDYGAATQAVLLDSGDYTAEELAAAGGYADQYCGIRLDTLTNDSVYEEGTVTYYRPGENVTFNTPLYKNGNSFVGFIDEDLKAVGDYSTIVTVVANEPGISTYTANYYTLEVDTFDKESTSTGYNSHNFDRSNSSYLTIVAESDGSTNTVLQHTSPAGISTGTLNFGFYSSGEAYIFEADIKWLGTSIDRAADNWIGRWGFVSDGTAPLSNADTYLFCNYASAKKDTSLYFTAGEAGYKTDVPSYSQATLPIGEWHRMRFEYVPLGENNGLYYGIQRVYFDGALAEERLAASKGDNSYMQTFRFAQRGTGDTLDWTMQFDNIVCYTVHEDYYGKGLYANDPDVNKYDGENANHSGGTIVTEANGNKVVQYNKKDGSGLTMAFNADGIEYGNTYVFDTDIKWLSMPYSGYQRNWVGRMGLVADATQFKGEDATFISRHYFGATPTQGMVLSESADSSYGSGVIKKARFAPGVWYNFRVEFTYTGVNADGKYTGVEKLYVNNELVSTVNVATASDVRGLAAYRFATLAKNSWSVQFDNTFIGVVGEESDYRNAIFDDGAISSGYFKASSTNGGAISEYAVVANPKGEGKVLKGTLTTAADQEVNTIYTMNANDAKATGTYELSLDMLFDSTTLPKDNTYIQQFVVVNSKGYTALFSLKHTTDGNVYITSDVDGGKQDDGVTPNAGKGGSLGTVKLLDGEWHNLRFVMYTNGTDSVYALYVDGALSGIGNYYHGIKACVINRVVTAETRYRIKPFAPQDASVTTADLYLDNIGLRYVGDIPDDIPDWDDAK